MAESVPAAAGTGGGRHWPNQWPLIPAFAIRGFCVSKVILDSTVRQEAKAETREEIRLNVNCLEPLPWESNTLIRLTIPPPPPS